MPQSSADAPALDRTAVDRWRRSWDEMMSGFLPGVASFEAALPVVTEALSGGTPSRVLDLGGGPGLFAERMAALWPEADVGMMDLDPVLLALARTGAGGRIRVHRGDLESPFSGTVAADGPYDLVTIVMTMHYLAPERARAVYRVARSVLRPGGLLVVADLMPDSGLAGFTDRLAVPGEDAAGLAWIRWWDDLRCQESLRPLLDERQALFADRVPAEFAPPVSWHRAAARQAGFTHSGVVWRWGAHAALAAIA
jgi:SAM-dependent methyltransferase